MKEMICHCGDHYYAKESNLKRGWGYSCSKSCAATRRDFGRPRAKPVDGQATKQTKKKPSSKRPNDLRCLESEGTHVEDEYERGWDGHKDSF